MTTTSLLSPEQFDMLPAYDDPDHQLVDNPFVQLKLYSPTLNWHWYLFERWRDDVVRAFVCGFDMEIGDVSIDELSASGHVFLVEDWPRNTRRLRDVMRAAEMNEHL